MATNTIIASPLKQHRVAGALLTADPRIDLLADGNPGPRQFKIKSADSFVRRTSASLLLKNRYSWRGYQTVSLPTDQTANRITLSAVEDEATIGTITVGLDGPEGLNSEDVFGDEIAALRAEGRRVCEFTKLAVDPITGTKRVLSALFHVAYVVAHRIRKYDTLVIEVNPRHVRYYERMLGFRVIAPARMNRSVNAPAVLLVADFSYIVRQIGEFGGQPDRAADERSLYPFFFSIPEEAGILSKLLAAQKTGSTAVN
ncbi:MAG TPA: long-chain N-acyl amino acid synthase [Rubrivivax sp.]|jgi:hypothetical protein|nr:long-chain N-acyl amino acid synthase [Rubrivivax sp.]